MFAGMADCKWLCNTIRSYANAFYTLNQDFITALIVQNIKIKQDGEGRRSRFRRIDGIFAENDHLLEETSPFKWITLDFHKFNLEKTFCYTFDQNLALQYTLSGIICDNPDHCTGISL